MNRFIQWLMGDQQFSGVATDWRLDFIGEYNNYVKLAIVLAGAVMVYLTVRSYRREGQAKPKAKVLLAAVRIAVIVLALMVLLRPAMVLRFTRTLYSNVVVLIDDSMSMSFKDRYASSQEKQGLASALKIEPAEVENLSRTEIVRKMLIADGGVMEKLAKDHPLDIMRFATNEESYAQHLGPVVEEMQISKQVSATPSSCPAKVASMLEGLRSDGFETNIPMALRAGVESLQGRRGFIVIISDGRMTADGASSRLAGVRDYAAKAGYPLYSVCVGDTTPPKNIAITSLQGPRDARKNATIHFVAKLAYRGLGSETVAIKLQRKKIANIPGQTAASAPASEASSLPATLASVPASAPSSAPASASAPSSAPGPVDVDWVTVQKRDIAIEQAEGDKEEIAAGDQDVEFSVNVDDTGEFVYRAAVDPRPDEMRTDDNSAEMNLKVVDKQIKVLLVSGGAGFEFQFLRNFLLAQSDLFKVSVWQENADPEINQAASTGMKLTEFPNALEAIMGSRDGKFPGYDVVVLYDPQAGAKTVDSAFADNLKKAVSTYGVGLCYIAGNKNTSLNLGTSNDLGSLRDLLPVIVSARETMDLVSEPKVQPLVLTAYGLDHPIMRVGDSTGQTQRLWESMPGTYWSHALLKLKPSSRVLLENGNAGKRMEKNVAEPLVVTQPLGRGRVLYLNFDETWRWRFMEDARQYRAFWSNAMRYLAPSGARQVIISTGGDRFDAGSRIDVEVEAYDDDYLPLKAAIFPLAMIDKQTGSRQEIVLQAVAPGQRPTSSAAAEVDRTAGRFKGTIPSSMSRVGTFDLVSLRSQENKAEPKEIRIELPQAEARRSEADAAAMENVASKSQYALKIQDVQRLAELIPADRRPAVREVPRELWDTHLAIVLIVGLLTVEWVLRKKYNMA